MGEPRAPGRGGLGGFLPKLEKEVNFIRLAETLLGELSLQQRSPRFWPALFGGLKLILAVYSGGKAMGLLRSVYFKSWLFLGLSVCTLCCTASFECSVRWDPNTINHLLLVARTRQEMSRAYCSVAAALPSPRPPFPQPFSVAAVCPASETPPSTLVSAALVAVLFLT